MRVRISYSVELEDVPSECARMLQDSLPQIDEVQSELESLIDNLDSNEAIGWQIKSRIDSCRQRLAKLDAILADNDMILEGYFKAIEVKEEPSDVSQG